MSSDRKVIITHIDYRVLEILIKDDSKSLCKLKSSLPKDAQIIAVLSSYADILKQFSCLIWSSEFEEIPLGVMPPIKELIFLKEDYLFDK